MSENTNEVVETTEAKSFIDILIDENRGTKKEDIEKLTAKKEDIETAVKDFKTFRNKYKHITIKSNTCCISDDDDAVWEIKDPEVLSESIDELRIYTRQYAIAKEKRLLFIIRQEELISIVNRIQGKLEKYDEFAKNHTDEEIGREFTNQQLQEFNMYRNQSIPMYLVELETLASAIKDNEETYFDSGYRIYEISSGIITYLEGQLSK